METRNEKTLREMIIAKGTFEFIDNQTDKNGVQHTFVKLGNDVAYPSKNVQEMLRTKGVAAINDIKFAEVLREEDNTWIPCLLSDVRTYANGQADGTRDPSAENTLLYVLIISYLLCLYTSAATETTQLIHIANLAVLVLLELTEHPGHGQHHTLLANLVLVPVSVAFCQSHCGRVKAERASQILHVQAEDKPFRHPHLAQTER